MAFEIFKQSMKEKTRGAIIVAILILVYVFFIGYSAPATKNMGGLDDLMKNPAIKALIGNMTVSITSFGFFPHLQFFSVPFVFTPPALPP